MIAEKSSGFTHNRGSLGFWVFVVVCAYFAFVSYWLIRGVIWSDKMISDYALCQALIKVPWRIIMFYSSELGAAVGVAFRSIAGCFALYSVVLFWRGLKHRCNRSRNRIIRTLPQICKMANNISLSGSYCIVCSWSKLRLVEIPF
jgi:hypothetical protein